MISFQQHTDKTSDDGFHDEADAEDADEACRKKKKAAARDTDSTSGVSDLSDDDEQGCAVSRYRFGRYWVGTNFWLCIWLGDPYFWYLLCKRYFFLILKIHFVVL